MRERVSEREREEREASAALAGANRLPALY